MARVIAANVLERLAEGSNEVRAARYQALVEAQASKLFGEGARARVQFTFPSSAIVVTDRDNPVWTVEFHEAHGGDLTVVRATPLAVASFSEGEQQQYVQAQCEDAVGVALGGDVAEAARRLLALTPMVVEAGPTPGAALRDLQVALTAPRFWRKRMLEQAPVVEKVLGAAPTPTFPVKYTGVYESTDEARLPGVQGDYTQVLGVLQRVEEKALELQGVVARYVESLERDPRGKASGQALAAFVEDFRVDVGRVVELAEGLPRVVRDVGVLAKGHDILAASVPAYERASAFLGVVVERVIQAAGNTR